VSVQPPSGVQPSPPSGVQPSPQPSLWSVNARRGSAFPATLQESFDAWLASPDGQRVYREVVERARTLRRRGWSHYGMKSLWEAIRYDWSVSVGPDADGWKVNNNWTSRMARRVMRDCPDLAAFFETRELKAQ
jgi:hypothetical protein